MTKIVPRIRSGDVESPDVLVGGTPCQAFSVAGLRGGLSDPRGGLTLEFVKIANAIDEKREEHGKEPSIIVWENVPGVLTSKDNAFGCFLGALAGEECEIIPPGKKWTHAGIVHGPQRTIAWRVLDAQYFGVAQRRKRVFVVASSGRTDPSKILFEFDGLRRDSPPSRETWETTTGYAAQCFEPRSPDRHEFLKTQAFTASSFGGYAEGTGTLRAQGGDYGGGSEVLITSKTASTWPAELACTLNAHFGDKMGIEDQHINQNAPLFVPAIAIQGSMIERSIQNGPMGPEFNQDMCFTLNCADRHGVAIPIHDKATRYKGGGPTRNGDGSSNGLGIGKHTDPCPTLDTGCNHAVAYKKPTQHPMQVRRLTPTECERLQGFPDSYTKIPWRKKDIDECPDGPRYKALGNSMAVPVMHWIGTRINRSLQNNCLL